MLTLEQVVAFALRDQTVLDQLGEALTSDLVLANPHYRRLATFANEFLLERRKLPGAGDWQVWLEGLPEGVIRDGARDALGALWTVDVSGFDAAYFADQAIGHLRQAAAQVAQARLNAAGQVTPELLATLAARVEAVQAGALRGLARLADVDTWAVPLREDDLIPTGYPTLDRLLGGWGRELWIVFADSGVGKSMLLANFAAAVALRGKRVLHVTLELGVRPQIVRYYELIAQVARREFGGDLDAFKRRLRQWFRLAKGAVYVLEQPAYALTPVELRRVVERAGRGVGGVDVLVLDYLDLMTVERTAAGRGRYEDLGRLTHELRSLCRTPYDLTVLTASQAVRKPAQKGRLTVRDMGDSYHKVRAADGLLSLVQTDEEEQVHQGRMGLLKVRDSGGRGTEVALYINRELSVIQELDHPNTRRLMERLGHLPVQRPEVAAP